MNQLSSQLRFSELRAQSAELRAQSSKHLTGSGLSNGQSLRMLDLTCMCLSNASIFNSKTLYLLKAPLRGRPQVPDADACRIWIGDWLIGWRIRWIFGCSRPPPPCGLHWPMGPTDAVGALGRYLCLLISFKRCYRCPNMVLNFQKPYTSCLYNHICIYIYI